MVKNGKLLDHDELLAAEENYEALQAAYSKLLAEPAEGLKELEALANEGSVASMMYLAHACLKGPCMDLAKAEKWYRAAYERRALNAFFGLGGLYYKQGRLDEAERIFSDGAAHGDGLSMFWLAKLYMRQGLFERRSAEIRDLLEKSAGLGQARAKAQLGLMYVKGRFGVRYIAKGLFLCLKAFVDGFRIAYRDPNSRLLR